MKNIKQNIYAIYTGCFVLIAIVIFLPFMLRGNSLVGLADSYNSVLPSFAYIRNYISRIFEGAFSMFDFKIGLGDDVVYTLAYMGIFDITSVISALLIPAQYTEWAFEVSIILKLYASGIGFVFFIKRYIKEPAYILSGALLYTFQVFTLFNGLMFSPHMLMRVTLPFVLAGTDEIFKNRRLSKAMILGLFFQGLLGFYCLYIEIVLVVLYYIISAVFHTKENPSRGMKTIVRQTLQMLLNGLLGVGLSGIILIPTLISIQYSTRKINIIGCSHLCYDLKTMLFMLGNLCVPNVYTSEVTLSLVTVCGVVLCFFSKKCSPKIKYTALIMWLISFSPIMGSVMNGFSYGSLRWFFAVGFFTDAAAVIAMEKAAMIRKKQGIIYLGIVIVTLILHMVCNENSIGMFIRVMAFMMMALLLVWVWNTKKPRYMLMYVSSLIMLMGLFTFGPVLLGGCGYSANFCTVGVYREIADSSIECVSTDEAFERWDIYDSSLNASLIGNYYGTSEYFSTINKYVSEFYQELSVSPGIRDASFILRGLDGRQEIMSLLSVSQYMDFETDDENERTSYIKDNEYYLPLGFTYDTYIERSSFDQLTPLEKSSAMMESVVLEESLEETGTDDITDAYGDEQIFFRITKINDKRFRIYFPYEQYQEKFEQHEGEFYVNISDLHGNADVYVGNKEIRMKDSTYLYYTGIEEYWFNLTEIKEDMEGHYFDINIDGETDFDETKLSVYYHPINDTGIIERQQNVMRDVQVDNNRISGSVVCEDREYLFLSVPYSKGWTAYVDGQKTDILRANIGFMAIPLEGGLHSIELKYVTPGLRLGIGCSLLSLGIIVVIYFRNKKKKMRSKNENFNCTDISERFESEFV